VPYGIGATESLPVALQWIGVINSLQYVVWAPQIWQKYGKIAPFLNQLLETQRKIPIVIIERCEMFIKSSLRIMAMANLATLLSTAAVAAPAYAADKAARDDKDSSYLYFRPAPAATSSLLTSAPRATSPLLGLRTAEPNQAPLITFSPTGKARDANKGVSLQLRSHLQLGKVEALGSSFVQPSVYDFNLALGFQGFAVDAGVARTAESTRTLSEAVNLGLSYGGKDWRTRLSVTDEKQLADSVRGLGLAKPQRALAFELGSSVQLAPNWALSGGIRYAIGQSMTSIKLNDPSQPNNRSVFVGTAFNF
jgi:hypothetical protein